MKGSGDHQATAVALLRHFCVTPGAAAPKKKTRTRCVEAVYWIGDYAGAPAARYLSSQAQPYNPVSTEQHLNFRYFDVPAGYANMQARLA
mmetsp:Transcript_21497/g.38279  ORF Transcript_21497/g.38279 Transcript_21497/m.38279 type:complete len:90 (-) Transcript_21497:721-990(-)